MYMYLSESDEALQLSGGDGSGVWTVSLSTQTQIEFLQGTVNSGIPLPPSLPLPPSPSPLSLSLPLSLMLPFSLFSLLLSLFLSICLCFSLPAAGRPPPD